MSVNNGKRTEISLPGYSGPAGFVELADRDTLSFPAAKGAVDIAIGATITVAGAPRRVTAAGPSPYLKNFMVLELAK